MKNNLKVHFYGGVDSVTGSNFVLSTDKIKIMVDCGLAQGNFKNQPDPNYEPFKYNPSEIDIFISTHAHIDHIGRIPKLVKEGFNGKIISTEATHKIVPLMFEDALNVLTLNAKRRKLEPLYLPEDVEKTMNQWESIPYHKEIEISDEFSLLFKDAGHILGSGIVYLKHKPSNQNIVFTGDLGNSPTPLMRDAEKINDADYLIMESVYGDRNHEDKNQRKEKLKYELNRIIERNGTLIIPVFSLEKTQVLLHELNDLIESGQVKSVPVFFDSPLGIKLTEVYKQEYKNFKQKVQDRILSGDDIFDFPKLIKTFTKLESRNIRKEKGAKIIVASSGMSVGGRVLSHEMEYLPDPKNAILFIGYQSAGSLGRDISEKNKKVVINRKTIPVKAEILHISGYSSHMDSDHLLEFVENTAERVKKVFVVMGETKSALYLTQKIRDNLDVNAVHPKEGDIIELD